MEFIVVPAKNEIRSKFMKKLCGQHFWGISAMRRLLSSTTKRCLIIVENKDDLVELQRVCTVKYRGKNQRVTVQCVDPDSFCMAEHTMIEKGLYQDDYIDYVAMRQDYDLRIIIKPQSADYARFGFYLKCCMLKEEGPWNQAK